MARGILLCRNPIHHMPGRDVRARERSWHLGLAAAAPSAATARDAHFLDPLRRFLLRRGSGPSAASGRWSDLLSVFPRSGRFPGLRNVAEEYHHAAWRKLMARLHDACDAARRRPLSRGPDRRLPRLGSMVRALAARRAASARARTV